ncbi:MAG: hypothetical protein Q9217_002916 [Psora testacea]
MSAAGEGVSTTTKATTREAPSGPTMKDQQKPPAALEEDDEFEDFPIDAGQYKLMRVNVCADWPASEQEVPPGAGREGESGATHLWEESWDDDDTSEEFSKQLKAELEKVKGNK